MKKILKITLILLVSIFSCSLAAAPVFADEILQVAGLTELMKCYDKKILKSDIANTPDKLPLKNMFQNDNDDNFAKVPNLWQNTIKDGGVSCSELVGGYSKLTQNYPKLISDASNPNIAQAQKTAFLTKMGYESSAGSSSGTKNHVKFVYQMTVEANAPSNRYTHQIFVSDIKNGKFTNNSIISVVKNGENGLPVYFDVDKKGTTLKIDCSASFGRGGCGDITIAANGSWDNFVNDIYQQLKAHASKVYNTSGDGTVTFTYTLLQYDKASGVTSGAVVGTDGNEVTGDWQLVGKDYNKAKIKALTSNSNFASVGEIKFTEQQKTTLHQHYFNKIFKAKLSCEGDADFASLPSTAIKVDTIKDQNCFATVAGDANAKVHAIKPDLTWYVDYNLSELMKNMTVDELKGAAAAATEGNQGDSGSDSDAASREPDCQTRSGALGWIICPLITTAADYIQRAYVNLIEPFLSIDAILFDTSTNGGKALRDIWSIFQGFANLVFVIVFLVVIFSQLTGVGIDNYGIKKILPKLIVGAILINLSYFICQLAIDLSNILGRAIGGLFNNMSADIDNDLSQVYVNLNPTEATGVQAFVDLAKSNLGVVVGIAGVLAAGAFLAAGPVIIIPALMALISLAVGAFFLFALLAIRQAVAVILVVVSPLAFAAYMLPNTKSLFKRWFDTFKGLLMAYPIASALVFGGEFVSKILLAASTSDGGGGGSAQETITSLGIILSAAVVAVAPIFYIPSLINKSLSALSGVTAALATRQKAITSNAQKRVDGGIRNSRLQSRMTSGIDGNGQLTLRGRIQNKLPRTRAGNARLAEARRSALSTASSDVTNKRMLTAAGVAATAAGIANKADSQIIDDEIVNMAKKTDNYNVDTMETRLTKLLHQDSLNEGEEIEAKALMKKLSQSGGDGNKRLANIVRNTNTETKASSAGKQVMANYATSTDIAGNISNKDAYVAQYLRDVQAGSETVDGEKVTTNTSFDQWSTMQIRKGDGDQNITNEEFVATKQLDDDQRLLQQSTTSLKQTYNTGNITSTRAERIMQNENLNKKDEQHKIFTNIQQNKDDPFKDTSSDKNPHVTPRPGSSGGGRSGSGGNNGGSGGNP